MRLLLLAAAGCSSVPQDPNGLQDERIAALEARVAQLTAEVEALSEHRVVTSRLRATSCVEETSLEELTEVTPTSPRLLLHRGPDGEFDGYRITGKLNKGSLAHRMGLRNGDILRRISGPDGAWFDLVTLELTRRGQRLWLDLELADSCPP